MLFCAALLADHLQHQHLHMCWSAASSQYISGVFKVSQSMRCFTGLKFVQLAL